MNIDRIMVTQKRITSHEPEDGHTGTDNCQADMDNGQTDNRQADKDHCHTNTDNWLADTDNGLTNTDKCQRDRVMVLWTQRAVTRIRTIVKRTKLVVARPRITVRYGSSSHGHGSQIWIVGG